MTDKSPHWDTYQLLKQQVLTWEEEYKLITISLDKAIKDSMKVGEEKRHIEEKIRNLRAAMAYLEQTE